MGKSIVFHLGPANDLDQRVVLIRSNPQSASPTTVYNQTLAGSTEEVEIELDDNLQCELKLTDRRAGVDGEPTVFGFATGNHLGTTFKSGDVKILSWEDTSSSSSVSSSSSSSSSSSQSSLSSLSSVSSSSS